MARPAKTNSHIVRSYGLFVFAGLATAGFMVRNWFASEKGRRVWEGTILRLPLVGPLVAEFAMARFCRMLGTLLGAGVPLVQALNVARKSIGNQILVNAVSTSIERVQEGERLGQSLAECRGLFPGSVLEMVSVAEESGRLDTELIRVANVTEGDLDRQLKTAVAFAEPLMLFLIAGFSAPSSSGCCCRSSPYNDTSNNPHTIMKNISSTFTRVPQEQRAFTLVELLLVLVILGTLAAIVLPKFSGVSQRGRVTGRPTDFHIQDGPRRV